MRVVKAAFLAGMIVLTGCVDDASQNRSTGSSQEQKSVVVPKGTISVGETSDDVVERLKDVRRLALVPVDADTHDDVRSIDEKAYALRFHRSDGPYRLVSIRRAPERDAEASTASLPDFERDLKKGMTMGEALPLLQTDGSGRFEFDTRDRFHARVQSSTGDFVLVYFDRPKNVPRPELVATATPEILRMSGSMPLNMLPEFTEYRLTAVRKEK